MLYCTRVKRHLDIFWWIMFDIAEEGEGNRVGLKLFLPHWPTVAVYSVDFNELFYCARTSYVIECLSKVSLLSTGPARDLEISLGQVVDVSDTWNLFKE